MPCVWGVGVDFVRSSSLRDHIRDSKDEGVGILCCSSDRGRAEIRFQCEGFVRAGGLLISRADMLIGFPSNFQSICQDVVYFVQACFKPWPPCCGFWSGGLPSQFSFAPRRQAQE